MDPVVLCDKLQLDSCLPAYRIHYIFVYVVYNNVQKCVDLYIYMYNNLY